MSDSERAAQIEQFLRGPDPFLVQPGSDPTEASFHAALSAIGACRAVKAVVSRELHRQPGRFARAFAAPYTAHIDGVVDDPPPELVVLQCVQPDVAGFGVSLFWPNHDVVSRISAASKALLESVPVRYQMVDRLGARKQVVTNVLRRRGASAELWWRYDRYVKPVPIEPNRDFARAIESLRRAAGRRTATRYECRPGDLLVIKNLQALHGRTELSSPNSGRLFRRAWLY